MKAILRAFSFFVVLALFYQSAGASPEPLGLDFEFEEKVLPQEQTRSVEKYQEIKLHSGMVFQVPQRPDVKEMKWALGLESPQDLSVFAASPEERAELRKFGIEVEMAPPEINPLEEFEKLTPQEQEKFQKIRMKVLAMVAKSLHHSRLALGAGMLIGDSFQFLKAKLKGQAFHFEPRAERRQKMIQSVLTSLDYRLFNQAPLVINANEMGFVLSVGAIQINGVKSRGWGGMLELGLIIAYNKETKSLVIENFIAPEKFVKSMGVVSVLGVNGKMGFFMANRVRGQETATRYTESFYPPAIPMFAGNGSKQFAFGLSSGIGFPPPPLADLLTFTNSHQETVTLRIEISRAVKGFVRLKTGEYKTLVEPLVFTFAKGFEQMKAAVTHWRGRSCQQVFSL